MLEKVSFHEPMLCHAQKRSGKRTLAIIGTEENAGFVVVQIRLVFTLLDNCFECNLAVRIIISTREAKIVFVVVYCGT